MIAQPLEAVSPPKSDSHLKLSDNSLSSVKNNYHRPIRRTNKNSSEKQLHDRFSRAFRSALFHRSQKLGRRLTRCEWTRLAAAVRKQISRSQKHSLVYELADLRDQFRLFRDSLPPNPVLEASESVMMLHNQLSMLRRQILTAIEESDRLTETCSHFKDRTIFYPVPDSSNSSTTFVLPGNHTIVYDLVPSQQQSCCSSCLERRKDCVFEWFGCEFTFNDFMIGKSPLNEYKLSANKRKKVYSDTFMSLSHIHPLAVQNIWSQIITLKFRS